MRGTFFIAVHKNIPARKTKLANPREDKISYTKRLSKKSAKATNEEKKNRIINGDFKMTKFIEFIALMASMANFI